MPLLVLNLAGTFAFGLERVLDGLELLIARRRSSAS